MIVQVVLGLAGLALLTLAADHLVLGSSRLARRLRVSPVVVGIVVIGLGTSAPEFLVSGLAAARGDTGLAVGNIVGSNVLNLTLLLGIAAIIAPMPVAAAVIRREIPLAFAGIVLFGALALAGLGIGTAVALTVAGVAALWLLVRWSRAARPAACPAAGPAASLAAGPTEIEEFETPSAELGTAEGWSLTSAANRAARWWPEVLRALLGLLGVLAGAQLLVDSATAVAVRLGVSQVVIGFTVVALGTSLPELVSSIQAQRRHESDLVIGNLFGSNLFNSLVGGAIIGFSDSAAPARAELVLVLAMVLTAGLAWALLRRGFVLNRIEGGILLLAYAAVTPLLLSASAG
jgi:cation:H+ antiporter